MAAKSDVLIPRLFLCIMYNVDKFSHKSLTHVSGIVANCVSLFRKQAVLSLPLAYHTELRFLFIVDVSMHSTTPGFSQSLHLRPYKIHITESICAGVSSNFENDCTGGGGLFE